MGVPEIGVVHPDTFSGKKDTQELSENQSKAITSLLLDMGWRWESGLAIGHGQEQTLGHTPRRKSTKNFRGGTRGLTTQGSNMRKAIQTTRKPSKREFTLQSLLIVSSRDFYFVQRLLHSFYSDTDISFW